MLRCCRRTFFVIAYILNCGTYAPPAGRFHEARQEPLAPRERIHCATPPEANRGPQDRRPGLPLKLEVILTAPGTFFVLRNAVEGQQSRRRCVTTRNNQSRCEEYVRPVRLNGVVRAMESYPRLELRGVSPVLDRDPFQFQPRHAGR